jgi:hypothetical protein
MKIGIEQHQNKGENSENNPKLFVKLINDFLLNENEIFLATCDNRVLDKGREWALEGWHTPGTGDGSLLEGHVGSV